MIVKVDVFVLGQTDSSEQERLDVRSADVRVIAAGELPAGQEKAERLNRLVADSDAEFLTFVAASRPLLAADIEPHLEQFQAAPETQLCLPRGDAAFTWVWTVLPSNLAALVHPGDFGWSGLYRAAAFDENGSFHSVDDPMWDWTIRAAETSPDAVCCVDSSSDRRGGCGAMPVLVPNEPGPERDWLHKHILEFDPACVMGDRNNSVGEMALRAGLLQLHDYLDESHRCSQSIEGDALGDHWHGIMHRREPDYSNSKYWFRRVGDSPIFGELAVRAEAILQDCKAPQADSWRNRLGGPNAWDPFAFVDLCQECAGESNAELEQAARRIQLWEMLLLLGAGLEF